MLGAVGIDLGTCKSVVAALRRGEPEAILNGAGSPLTPSTLASSATGELLVGQAAEECLAANPARGVRSFYSQLGRRARAAFNGLQYTPGELAAIFLARLREEAEAALGGPVRRAVLAVPASFTQRQMAALHRAAALAGLFVLRLCPAPTAAALAYSLDHPQAPPETVLVCDLGGGCLDVAVIRLFHGALTVLGLAGEGWLGGNDLTEAIVAHLLQHLNSRRGPLLHETEAARNALRERLRVPAERAKLAISTVERANLALPPEVTGLAVAVEETLTRSAFEEMVRPRLEEALVVVEQAMLAAGLSRESIDGILLVGGSTQLPLLQRLLAGRYRQARFRRDLNPLLGVAMGAAALAGTQAEVVCPTCRLCNPVEAPACRRCGRPLAGEDRVLCRRCFVPNDARRQACWKCGASLRPARAWPPAAVAGTRVCPACGATVAGRRPVCSACHAPVYAAPPTGLRCSRCGRVAGPGASSCPSCGEVVAPFIGGVTGRSLGIESRDGSLDVVLPKGHPIPSPQPAYRRFRTAGVDQRQLEVTVYEGDRPTARDNPSGARLRLSLPAGLRPQSAVRVAFSLDQDGLLAVCAALEDGSGREVDVRLERG